MTNRKSHQPNALPFLCVGLCLALALAPSLSAAIPIEQGFKDPPAAARPHTWWHWMNGNITKEGITADLEAMAGIGLGGANIFNVSCDIPEGPVRYMSPEWLDLFHHAASEAKRLGLELGFQNCAGWATTGGPWVKPEDNMQQLVSTTTLVKGGGWIRQQLPRPESRLNYYHDISILAFPTPKDNQQRVDRWETKTLQSTARAGLQPHLDKTYPAESVIAPEAVVDWAWQKLNTSRKVVSANEPRCIVCHTKCGVPPDGYEGTCAVAP